VWLALLALTAATWPAQARGTQAITLYDGSAGGTPDTQGMSFQGSASQQAGPGFTTLDTRAALGLQAGYLARPALLPPLDRARGYGVRVDLQLVDEQHGGSDSNRDGLDDRAGTALVVVSADLRGIELSFWGDRVWAQADGDDGMLFTQAEGATADMSSRMRALTLVVLGDRYTLRDESGATILSGRVRSYAAAGFPYDVPGLLFVGDDSTSAMAETRIALVAAGALESAYLPLVAR
jgi:hypothetical protein